MGFAQEWNTFRSECDEEPQEKLGKGATRCSPDEGHDDGFGYRLAYQVRPGCNQSGTNGEFSISPCATGHQEIGDICACDQEHRQDYFKEFPCKQPHVMDLAVAHGAHLKVDQDALDAYAC